MPTTATAVSEEILNEFRNLVYQKYQKFGKVRTEVDRALKKHIDVLKQELAEEVSVPV